jgi:hypothetical protein
MSPLLWKKNFAIGSFLEFSHKIPQILGDDIIAFQYHAMLLFKARGDSDNIYFPSILGIFLEYIQESGNMAFDIRQI